MATPEPSEPSSSKPDSGEEAARPDGDRIPTGKVRRASSTTAALGPSGARLAATLIANLGRSPERAREVLEERHAEVAQQAVGLLGNLRGGAMKLGQLASFVDVEFLPPEYRAIYQEKLASLRDSAPAMSWEKVRSVLEHEWEQPVSEVLASVTEEAVAAASIGQVHRGVLHDGREVAIKVQYPEIADALESDLEIASVLIGLGRAIAPGLDPKLVAGELRERVLEELDFELEAQQQRRFARAYRGHPFIYVPPVLTSLSRQRVLVSEWVTGRRFDEVLALGQDERDRVGEIIVRFFFGSMDRVGAFNTDPHPGNYMLLEDGRMAFLDFGNTVAMSPETIELQRRAVMAGVEGDGERFAGLASELGYVRNMDRLDRDAFLTQWLLLADWYVRDQEVTIDPDYVASVLAALIDPRAFDGAMKLVRQIKVPPEEIWVRRVETSVLAVLGQLRATRNWHRIMLETLGGEPATELGESERAFWKSRGREG